MWKKDDSDMGINMDDSVPDKSSGSSPASRSNSTVGTSSVIVGEIKGQ
jgi:hypothetical protein